MTPRLALPPCPRNGGRARKFLSTCIHFREKMGALTSNMSEHWLGLLSRLPIPTTLQNTAVRCPRELLPPRLTPARDYSLTVRRQGCDPGATIPDTTSSGLMVPLTLGKHREAPDLGASRSRITGGWRPTTLRASDRSRGTLPSDAPTRKTPPPALLLSLMPGSRVPRRRPSVRGAQTLRRHMCRRQNWA